MKIILRGKKPLWSCLSMIIRLDKYFCTLMLSFDNKKLAAPVLRELKKLKYEEYSMALLCTSIQNRREGGN